MRGLVFVFVFGFAGCMTSSDRDPFGGPSSPSQGCSDTSPCGGGDVCTRTRECMSPDQVFNIRVQWTIEGMAPTAASCTRRESFSLMFSASSPRNQLEFAPVPCVEGVFSIQPMPRSFNGVWLGVEGTPRSYSAEIDRAGIATLDVL